MSECFAHGLFVIWPKWLARALVGHGSKPRTPSEHPNPTTKTGSKMHLSQNGSIGFEPWPVGVPINGCVPFGFPIYKPGERVDVGVFFWSWHPFSG